VLQTFLPVKALSRTFRGKFAAALKRTYRNNELCLPGALKPFSKRRRSARLCARCSAMAGSAPLIRRPAGRSISSTILLGTPTESLSRTSLGRFRRRQGYVWLEGLRPLQQTTADEVSEQQVFARRPAPVSCSGAIPGRSRWTGNVVISSSSVFSVSLSPLGGSTGSSDPNTSSLRIRIARSPAIRSAGNRLVRSAAGLDDGAGYHLP
jgi:hypothetical protein